MTENAPGTPASQNPNPLTEFLGPPIDVYLREQAIEGSGGGLVVIAEGRVR